MIAKDSQMYKVHIYQEVKDSDEVFVVVGRGLHGSLRFIILMTCGT